MAVSVVFTGDIGFDRYMARRWEDDCLLSPEIVDFCRGADHVVANVEGALTRARDESGRGVFFHTTDPAAARVLERIQADVWHIANNHISDAGSAGVADTMAEARRHGAVTLGAGLNIYEASRPVYLEGAGGIGLLGVAYLSECVPATEASHGIFPWNDMELIARRIREIKQKCRWCVVVSHGGEEFASLPNPYTRDRYIGFLRLGADAVVAHHPHVTENYERFEDGKLIFYSLGNFIFDTDYQRAHQYTDRGVMVKLIFDADRLSFEAQGISILRGAERIAVSPLPDIFTDVNAAEYARLAPLNAAAFLAENRRTQIYLDRATWASATETEWNAYFYGTDTDGYCKGQHMDLSLIKPLADRARDGAWRESRLETVKAYILRQFQPEFAEFLK